MWTKDANAPGPATCFPGTIKTWQGALDYLACLNTNASLGYTDWRLPNANEIESIINAGQSDSATWLNTQGFSNVQSYNYWSSTSGAYYPLYAWYVNMWYGGLYADNKSYYYYVWPVRSGQSGSFGSSIIQLPATGQTVCYDSLGSVIACAGTGQDGEIKAGVAWPSPRFTVIGDCVTDNLTGLMWTKNANLAGSWKTWQAVLDYANGLSLCGYTDWHLPNRKELHSLTDFSQYRPALPSGHPFLNVNPYYYWSSTSYASSPFNAWIVDMWSGGMGALNKSNYGYLVWLVRCGQVGPLCHSISGKVTEDNAGLSGVTMTLGGANTATATTATDGSYSFQGLLDGSYTITPSLTGYCFTPESLSVTLSGADITAQDFSVTNCPPVLDNIGSKSIKEGHTLSFTISGSDPDGDTLDYSASDLPAGAFFDGDTKTFSWIPDCTQAGLYSVTFTVSDGELIDSEVVAITVNENSPPAITFDPAPPYSVNEGSTLTFNVKISDPDGDDVGSTYSTLPFHMDCIDSYINKEITLECGFSPDYTQAGEYNVKFTWFDAVDQGYCTEKEETITITVNNVNRPPELDTIGPKSIKEGSTLSFTVSSNDPDGDTLTYNATGLPAGASFDTSTRDLSYTPGYAVSTKAGDSFFDVFFEVSDGNGGTDSETVWITVQDVNRPPVANAGPDQTVEATSAAGASVTLNGTGSSDPDGDTLTFNWSGASISATGATPTVTLPIGTHTITLTVTDAAGATATDTIQVTIQDTTAPTLTVPADVTVEATGPTGATVNYAAATASDAVDPSPVITYSKTSGTVFPPGTTTVTVTASDASGNSASASFKVTVQDTTPPTITSSQTPAPNANGWNNSAVTVTFTATDAVSDTIPCEIVALSLSSNSPISATVATEGSGQTVTVACKDGSDNSATANYTVNIDLTPSAIAIGSCPSTVVLKGTASVTVTVADTLSGLASQSLPDGSYTLDTSTVGTKTFTVTAQDNAGNSSSGICNYQVVYSYPGTNLFKSPIASPPAVNSAKAGSTVPVKWQLTDASGAFIGDTGAVSGITSYPVSCSNFTSDTINEVPVDTSGNSGLRYDAATNQYIYTWKTPGTPGCYVLKLTLNDGSSYLANFQLK